MADCRFPSCSPVAHKDTVCVETNRILDCCRDRDCFENVRVFLSGVGNDIIAHTSAVRARDAEIVRTSIGVDPIQFNRGFYSVSIRYFVRLIFEACIAGGRAQEFEGIAVLDKNVILYGGESSVRIFRSDPDLSQFCALPEPSTVTPYSPIAVVEAVDPVVLGCRVLERTMCSCCCSCSDIPSCVLNCLCAPLCPDDSERYLTVSLGIFSVVRLTRPAQLMINASEYAVPDKECFEPKENDPCSVFRKMAFPVSEFSVTPPPEASACKDRPEKHCSC